MFGTESADTIDATRTSKAVDANSSGSTATFPGKIEAFIVDEPVETKFVAQTFQKKRKVVTSTVVAGLDSSIVIDPRRLHMTLGVMALEPESQGVGQDNEREAFGDIKLVTTQAQSPIPSPESEADEAVPSSPLPPPPKTVSSALVLLRSLQPEISQILQGNKGVQVPLDILDVLKTGRMGGGGAGFKRKGKERAETGGTSVAVTGNTPGLGEDMLAEPEAKGISQKTDDVEHIGAGVLFVGPSGDKREYEATKKLMAVCDLIHATFRREGYITDKRPLKLHCTILNTSHRKPPRPRMLFSYTDILSSGACSALRAEAEPSTGSAPAPEILLLTDDSLLTRPSLSQLASMEHSVDVTPPLKAKVSNIISPPALALPVDVTDSSLDRQTRSRTAKTRAPPSLKINLGSYAVSEVQLWVMGSHGQNNEYVSCGGVRLE